MVQIKVDGQREGDKSYDCDRSIKIFNFSFFHLKSFLKSDRL